MYHVTISLFSGKTFTGNAKRDNKNRTIQVDWSDGEILHTAVIPLDKIYKIYYF